MAVNFDYGNSVDAGTPAVAAEIQGNFDDLLAWIKSYYQQADDTTTEINAAIASNNETKILDNAVQTGAPILTLAAGEIIVPGMQVSWTAESNHMYRIDIANVNIQLDTTNGQRVTLSARAVAGGTNTIVKTVSISNTSYSCVLTLGGSAFLTGLSGTTTYGAYLRRDLLVGASGTPTGSVFSPSAGATGVIVVSDLGVVS